MTHIATSLLWTSRERTHRRFARVFPFAAAALVCYALAPVPVAVTASALDIPSFQPSVNAMRAWTCHGRTQQEMVSKLKQAGIIKHDVVQDAMNKVDRANYVLDRASAHVDAPQSIGYGQTISAPHMHAHVLEDLLPALLSSKKSISILDVGCGSGYLTACLGRLVDTMTTTSDVDEWTANVYGIDFLPELVTFSMQNMQKEDGDLLVQSSSDSGSQATVELKVGDGWKGLPEAAPFDAIHVGAAADTFPKNLMSQLAVGGIMICPVGPDGGYQSLYKIKRLHGSDEHPFSTSDVDKHSSSTTFTESDYDIEELIGVRYVPLVHLNE
mmetsp:Transcript_10848/g.19831  ORF Transcript_10848/g.19831 Transcript_10848/m.19831 type:complete len:327 (-) Transcript_10848:173-1153(-)